VHRTPPIILKIACLAVVLLTMWLGGFGCSLCCATGLTESCCLNKTITKQVSSKAACAESGCCKRAKREIIPSSAETALRSAGEIGCRLLPNQSASLTVAERATDDRAIQGAAINALPLLGTSFHPSRIVDPPLPRNRGATYLRCCALLI
jgi:hypothetical protein